MATLLTVRTSIKNATDHDTDDQGGTATVLNSWINEEYLAVRRLLHDVVPDLYTVLSGDFTVAAGVTTYNPGALSNLEKIRLVEQKINGVYYPLPPAPPWASTYYPKKSYRLIYGPTIEFLPHNDTAGTYRLRYIVGPSTLVNDGDLVELPRGGDRVLIERVAARVRQRLEEDPTFHLQRAEEAWRELRKSVVDQYRPGPQGIQDISGRFP